MLCKGRKTEKKGGIKRRKGGRYKVRKAKKKREEGEREGEEDKGKREGRIKKDHREGMIRGKEDRE